MARSTPPRFSKVTPKRLNTTPVLVISAPPGVLSIAALEQMWHKPDAVIETWVANGDLARRDDYYFDRIEIARFSRERADLLALDTSTPAPALGTGVECCQGGST